MKIQLGVPEADYHSWNLMSASALKVLDKATPMHLTASREEREDTPAFRLGRALHSAILTPSAYEQDFAVAPQVDKRTKAGKEEWESFASINVGRTLLTRDEANQVDAMVASIKQHTAARQLIASCADHVEVTLTGEMHGVQCKARLDGWSDSTGTIIDIKTHSGIASPQEFSKAAWNFGYWTQFAFYRECLRKAGKEVHNVILIVVEKSAPHAVMCAGLHIDGLDAAAGRIPELCDMYREFEMNPTKGWNADDIYEIRIPSWATNDLLAPTGD